jgi:hypothetical protein
MSAAAEPQWQTGDLAIDAAGTLWGHTAGPYPWAAIDCIGSSRWPAWAASNGISDADVPRPLTPLVRSGKPWGDA